MQKRHLKAYRLRDICGMLTKDYDKRINKYDHQRMLKYLVETLRDPVFKPLERAIDKNFAMRDKRYRTI